ncbi:MAG: hypothetical protein DCF29_08170 [Alphaproteobacteria bacterium]|nr:MAG: hypothetical protein DCF29_08170 [Alphaproteobacteria bacterium]
MALGRFSDENLALTATLGGGVWSPVLPLANLKDQSRFISAPARQMFPNDPTKARIEAVLERDRTINLVAVLFHTLGLTAEYRLTVAGPGGTLAAPLHTGDWTPVHGRMFPSVNLPWEEPNWWLGSGRPEDLVLYPRHLWIVLRPGLKVSAVRIEFRDPDAAWFDIGGLWIASTWSPTFNFDHGRELGLDARSLADETPSGRVIHEERVGRRRLTVSWSMLEASEALKLFDAGARCGTKNPVLLLPDVDDPVALIREAFPATFEKPPAPRRGRKFETLVNATLKEIIA